MMASQSSQQPGWESAAFSPSTNQVLEQIASNEDQADIVDIVEYFLAIHPEYGDPQRRGQQKSVAGLSITAFSPVLHSARDFPEDAKAMRVRTSREWAGLVQTYVDTSSKKFEIHGRLFIICCIISESEIFIAAGNPGLLQSVREFVKNISSELKEDPQRDFTPQAKQQWKRLFKLSEQNLYESANLTDRPGGKDLLSRQALAKYLAKRLKHVYKREIDSGLRNSFFMHIDGAWGSGKSTLLEYLREELEQNRNGHNGDDSWMVIDFNAWQNQRLDPPWWFFMRSLHQQVMAKLFKRNFWRWCKMALNEFWWRHNTGTNYLVAVILTGIVFGLTIGYEIDEEAFNGQPVIKGISLLGVIWTFTQFLRTNIISGSAKAAKKFIEENGNDPMRLLTSRFKKKVRATRYPIAVFIDDLDRCNKDYGIRLLEGLQTIFQGAPVVYVIAADRRWLNTMYETEFNMFASAIARPGKPFGFIFLDKIFQLIVELPSISSLQKKNYWNYLLNISADKAEAAEKLRADANAQLGSAGNNLERFNIANTKAQSPLQKQIMREEYISTVSIREEEAYVEHRLQNFLDLVEPNPRSMKRIINDISTARAITFLYDQEVGDDQLILWTIMKLRYPGLAEFFWNEPEMLDQLTKKEINTTGDTSIDSLLQESEVKQLFSFHPGPEVVKIDSAFLRKMKFEETGERGGVLK